MRGTRYGAIAYSPTTGAWTTVHGYSDKNSAEATVLSYCKLRAPDCKILVLYTNTCLAMDTSQNGVMVWDVDPSSRGIAETQARKDCLRMGGKGCRTAVSDCSQR